MPEEQLNQPGPDEASNVAVQEPPADVAEHGDVDDSKADGVSLRDRLTGIVRAKWKPAAIAGATLILPLLYFWAVSGSPEKTPKQIMNEALARLESSHDAKSRDEAQEMAYVLKKMDYQDPDFPGALYFIFGVVAFRNAEELNGESQDHQYLIASRYLKEAERRAVDQEHRPEWAFTLGTSLYLLGFMKDSRPLLEEAITTYPEGKLKTSILLTDIYLDDKEEAELNKAFKLNTEALQVSGLEPLDSDRLYLQRAQIFLAQGKNDQAQQVLSKVKQKDSVNQVTVVFQAQTLMAEGKYKEALAMLAPVKDNLGLERKFPRQASYLMGICAEALNDIEAAIGFYEQTTHRYAGTHEGLAAYLHLGDLLRKDRRTEEALIAYRTALRSIGNPRDFRNRWIGLEQVQDYVLDAWNDWVDEEKIENGVTTFDTAILLADYLPPLLPEVQAKELAANASRRWAEYYERLVEKSPVRQQETMQPLLKERWRQSGFAFYELSRLLQTTDRYGEILSISAEHFQKGQDFETALKVLTRFVNTKPDKKMPQALVRRGEILLELDQLDEAINHFERVMTNYPTDVASFEAKYLLGVAYLEKDELDQASRVWSEILASSTLTPKAKQWRDSLFALGRLDFHRGRIVDLQVTEAASDSQPGQQTQAEIKTAYYDKATERLVEFVDRYPESEKVYEARYLLARSLQNQSDQPHQEMLSAKTDNARQELKRKKFAYLRMANQQLHILNRDLRKLEAQDRLDFLGKRLLKSACFGTAHLLFLTEDYEEAIKAYHEAVNRYPQCTEVLIAYMKMSGCYERLGKKNESKSMLEQAKIILKQMPDKVFESKATNLGREEWNRWLDWSREFRKSDGRVNQLQTGAGV